MASKPENMVLRTVYLPKSLDEKLRAYAHDSSSSKGELIRELIFTALKTPLDKVVPKVKAKTGDETMVLRTVFLPKDRDNELKKIAFQRGQSKGELMRDLIQKTLSGTSGPSGGSRGIRKSALNSNQAEATTRT